MSDHFAIEFNAEHRLAICRPDGALSSKHTADLLNFLIPLERFESEPFNRLLDLMQVTEVNLSSTLIRAYATARQESVRHLAPFRTAIIVPVGHSAESAAILYAILMKGSKIEVCVLSDPSSAAAWLGVPEKALHSDFAHTPNSPVSSPW